MPPRSETPIELTWDLTHLYQNEADFNADMDQIQSIMGKILAQKGQLTVSPAALRSMSSSGGRGMRSTICVSMNAGSNFHIFSLYGRR